MAKKRRKRKNPPKSKKPQSSIPEGVSQIRFFIFLAVGVVLFALFYYFAIVEGGF